MSQIHRRFADVQVKVLFPGCCQAGVHLAPEIAAIRALEHTPTVLA